MLVTKGGAISILPIPSYLLYLCLLVQSLENGFVLDYWPHLYTELQNRMIVDNSFVLQHIC